MKPHRSMFAAILSLAILSPFAAAQTPDARLTAVLAQLDASSQKFKSARANFVSENYESIVKETTVQTGITYFERNNGSIEIGTVVMAPKKSPADKDKIDKILQYKNDVGQLFDLSIDQIRVMNAGKQGTAQTFLTLGFGSSGKDLARSWDIKYLGSETLSDDGQPVKTEKLDLVSKDEGVRNNYTHIVIWVDPVRDVTLRQVFETPSHDRRTVNNSHIVLNGKIDKSIFAIKKGPHTTVVGP
jgi:outer membrane lipoprotein-sorting protein